jgi:hypothetical protein
MMKHLSSRMSLALLALAFATSAPALASGSVAGGIFSQSGNGQSSTGAGVLLSTSSAVPVLPVSVGVTGFVPLAKSGGYAVTVDGTFALGGNAIGVGYGLGQFGGARAGGTGTLFFDHRIAPLTSIELRGYSTTGTRGVSAGLLAVKFSL